MSREQRILMPTTNSGYGIGDDNNFCTEETPLRPISLYGATRSRSKRELMQRDNAISFRLATVFGMSPRMRIDLLVNDFVYRAVHDRFVVLFEGDFKRNYIHVRDVARRLPARPGELRRDEGPDLQRRAVGCQPLQARTVRSASRQQVPDFVFLDAPVGKDPDKRDYIVSNAKLEAPGYKPAVSLDAGIAELIKGFTMVKNTVHGNV